MLAKTPITDTYLSAAKLGITEAERDALIWVREELASGRLLHVVKPSVYDGAQPAFNMNFWTAKSCGTVHCIGGWMQSLGSFGGHEYSMKLSSLFYPNAVDGENWALITPAQAIRAIDFFATGHQRDCWSLAIAEG